LVSETRYMRSDQHTINGLLAYKLLTTNTASSTNVSDNLALNYRAYWGIRVFIRHADESEDEVTSGTPVAQVSRSSNGEGMQSNTWNCPETALEDDDAIIVRVYLMWEYGSWTLMVTFITNQVQDWDSPTQLDSATWTVYYYTLYSWDSKLFLAIAQFYWGDNVHNSRITNFTWSEGAPPAGVLRRLLVGVGL
jgi:hypothetical protein